MSELPSEEDLEEVRRARQVFDEQLMKADVTGYAFRAAPHPDIRRAMWNAFELLADAERRLVAAHQRVFQRPTAAEMLRCACEEAALPLPHAGVDPDHWEFWAEDVAREANLHPESREFAKHLLDEAQRYARLGRFFSAAEMLKRFVGLRANGP